VGLERRRQRELSLRSPVIVPGEEDRAERIGGAEMPGVVSQDRAVELLGIGDLAAIMKGERSLILRIGIGNLTGDQHR
jgi:hypothetical protein